MPAIEQPKHSAFELFLIRPTKRQPSLTAARLPDSGRAQVITKILVRKFVRYRVGVRVKLRQYVRSKLRVFKRHGLPSKKNGTGSEARPAWDRVGRRPGRYRAPQPPPPCPAAPPPDCCQPSALPPPWFPPLLLLPPNALLLFCCPPPLLLPPVCAPGSLPFMS